MKFVIAFIILFLASNVNNATTGIPPYPSMPMDSASSAKELSRFDLIKNATQSITGAVLGLLDTAINFIVFLSNGAITESTSLTPPSYGHSSVSSSVSSSGSGSFTSGDNNNYSTPSSSSPNTF